MAEDLNRARHLELIPAEGSALIKEDEAWMLTKEAEVDQRLRGKGRGQGKTGSWWSQDWKGKKSKDGGKEKERKGSKAWKGWWKQQKGGTKAEGAAAIAAAAVAAAG